MRAADIKSARVKFTIIIILAFSLLVVVSYFLIFLSNNKGFSTDITYQDFSEELVSGLETRGTFSESLLSTKVNAALYTRPQMLKDFRSYEDYISKYVDIYPAYSPSVSQTELLFSKGYVVLVASTDAYQLPCNIMASYRVTDGQGNISIVLIASEIDPEQNYVLAPSKCKQASVAIYLPSDELASAKSVIILMQR